MSLDPQPDTYGPLTRVVRDWRDTIRQCEHRTAKIVLAVTTALFSAAALRVLMPFMLALLPDDGKAGELAHQAINMSSLHFAFAAAVATFGGAASLFHELRTDMSKFTIMNAIGHMVVAQFAGLLIYLLGVTYEYPVPLAMVGCGIAGWGGGKVITLLSDRIMPRFWGEK